MAWLTTFGGGAYGDSAATGGVAAFSGEIVRALRANGMPIDVLADIEGTNAADPPYVRRTWRHGNVSSLLKSVLRPVRVLHVQHEVFLYGGAGSAIALPALVALARLRGTKIVVTFHGVVDRADVDADFARRYGVLIPAFALRLAFGYIFGTLGRLANRVVVHDVLFARRLHDQYGVAAGKIDVVPLIMPSGKRYPAVEARAALSLPGASRVIVFFGFITAYKGIDELLATFEELLRRGRDVHLVIAGGAHPKKAADAEYRSSYEVWRERALATGRATWLGYVDGADRVDQLLSAADVMVLPYRELLSMSGPLSSAAAHGMRVVCSTALAPLVADDVPTAPLEPAAFADAIERALDADAPASFAQWREERSGDAIAARYRRLYGQLSAR